ncbi:WD repeat-containing protein 49 isoform X2 [Hemicordylus capensis]|uniref:WD repeat-containing protein 49 isoform X2 n=1 Tax=Hemicordylus capensis TaxID=884348 RepID=UPI002302508F|nr:WD repeat-containing protein 49 isoform X2 [Hemicordylus capensis]
MATTRDRPLTADSGAARSLEQLENRLTIHDYRKMQELFMSPELNENMGLKREDFVEKMSAVVRRGTKEEYGELFDKIDLARDGLIDWNKLTSFVLLELYETDERAKRLVIPQWKDLHLLPLIHKDAVQNVTSLKSPIGYLTVGRSGLIGIWGESLKLQRTLQITTEGVKPKDLWVTCLVVLPNVNKVAVAFTSKEIYFAELNSKQGFSCQYKLQGLEGTVICMDYWYNPHDGNEAILTLGDVCGQVQAIAFNTALISLFERPSSSPEDENVTMTIKWQELVSGYHKCCCILRHKLHDKEWVRQVAYSSSLDVFMSVTTSSTNTLVLAWREMLSPHLTMTTCHIPHGVNAFDFHAKLNLIATAGINRRVCLWNPYVTSKPAGVLEGHSDSVMAVQFITERKLLFSFSKDKVLRIWDIQHQLCIQRISGSFPKSLDFHSVLYFDEPHGRLFISFNNQLTLLELEQDSGKSRITSHRKAVTCILYNSVFKQVISSDTGSTVIFWLLDTGQKIKEFTGCHGNAEISTMALDGTQTRLFTGSTDGTVKDDYCLPLEQPDSVFGSAFGMERRSSTPGRHLMCSVFTSANSRSSGGEIVVWNNSTETARIKLHLNAGSQLKTDSDSQMQQKVTPTGGLSFRRHTQFATNYTNFDSENCNTIARVSFLDARKNVSVTGGANLVTCGGAGCVRFWNTHRSRLLAEFEAHSGVGSVIMTLDQRSQYLITGDLAGWLKIWHIEDYCLALEEIPITEPPPLIRALQPHDDCITDLATCIQNSHLFVLSSSADCSVALTDISGIPFGVFGQEGHWRIGNYVPISSFRGENKYKIEEENDIKKNKSVPFVEEGAPANPVEQAVPVAEDKEDSAYVVNVWDNTILGKKYKEEKTRKGRKYTLLKKATRIKPIVVFRSLNIEALKETTEMNKLNFLLHPDKYFGEKLAEKSSEDLKPPTLSATLKAAFDEKNLFPKEILDREKKFKATVDRFCPALTETGKRSGTINSRKGSCVTFQT